MDLPPIINQQVLQDHALWQKYRQSRPFIKDRKYSKLFPLGLVHRNEKSGTLHGLMRVRSFTQDDAHIFMREDQIMDEIQGWTSPNSPIRTGNSL